MNIFTKVVGTKCVGDGELGEECPNFQGNVTIVPPRNHCPGKKVDDDLEVVCGSKTEKVYGKNWWVIAIAPSIPVVIGLIVGITKFSVIRNLVSNVPLLRSPQIERQEDPPNNNENLDQQSIPVSIVKKIDEARGFADISNELIESPENLTSYEQAINNLSRAIQVLELIKTNGETKIQIQKDISSYKELITEIENKIIDEEKAQLFLKETQQNQLQLESLSESYTSKVSKRISENIKIRAAYEQGLKNIQTFLDKHSSTPSSYKLVEIKQKYEVQIASINNEISRLKELCGESSDGIGETGTCIPTAETVIIEPTN